MNASTTGVTVVPSESRHTSQVAALAAHTTQTASLIELIGPDTYREWWRTESFHRAPTASSHLCFAELAPLAA